MRSIVTIVVVAFLSGCMATTPNRPSVASKTPYGQIGAMVYSPNEAGWFLAQSNNLGVAFGKQYGSPQDTAIANTVIFQVEGFEGDSEFLTHIAEQREKQDDKSRFKILEVNNEQVSYKNTSCLKYNGVSEDHKNDGINSNDFQYLKTVGYICRHPSNKVIAFEMEVSHRSSEKKFPEGLLSVGGEFFSDIQFNDNGLK